MSVVRGGPKILGKGEPLVSFRGARGCGVLSSRTRRSQVSKVTDGLTDWKVGSPTSPVLVYVSSPFLPGVVCIQTFLTVTVERLIVCLSVRDVWSPVGRVLGCQTETFYGSET